MTGAIGFLAAVFLLRAALGVLFQAPGAAGPVLVPAFGMDWTQFGTLVGLFWLPGLLLAIPIGLAAPRLSDRRMVLAGMTLLVAGGLVSAAATVDAPVLLTIGRLLMGCGTVMVIVLMTKMMQDRFKGADLFPAMAVYVLGWPVGIAAAQAVLPGLAVDVGWQLPFLAGAAAMALALFAIAAASRPSASVAPPPAGSGRLTGREIRLMCLAGGCWAMVNGTYMVLVTFAPPLLTARGLSVAEAGFATSLMSWVNLVAVPAGAMLARRPSIILPMVVGSITASAALAAALPYAGLGWAAVILALHGLLYALPITVFSALPALAVPPERRAQGLGVYFVWFYGGCTGFPPLAGWLADQTGGATVPVLFAAGLLVGALVLFLVFRRVVGRG
ncbi:MFS transporter [Roseomonas terrae]|jgi:MFS family permease|uniref:MFS transporter n=1 Tax=Neoroseomonas terrae TaxID=424799 RepID=A0ABS5EJD8_9PROT|nr:MFS transporter [Neoroseomonas terrae]MBR0651144.1 MFS transporter [Neoroseomonas terrae]